VAAERVGGLRPGTAGKLGGVASCGRSANTTVRGELRQMDRISPSAPLKAPIVEFLIQGLADDGERLAEIDRLGARLVLQRAVEDEVTAFLGRARYQRTPERPARATVRV
jgi:hypothetical protein